MKNTTKNNKKRLTFFMLMIMWMITVFWFSNQPAGKSENTSLTTTETILDIFTTSEQISIEKSKLILILDPIVRKLAHYSIYMLGGIIILSYINTYSIKERKKIFYSICIGAIYAFSDELHQYFVDGRSAQITDVLIDTLGVLTGICLFLCIVKITKKIKDKMIKK